MSLDRMLTLAGFNKRQETITALKQSKAQLSEAHDMAIKQAEKGLPIDEGLMTGLRAAIATAAQGAAKVTKSVARKAADLSDGVKKMYIDNKAKLELQAMLKGMITIAASFEKLEKDAPTIIKKDERVREIVKVFRDAMETMVGELKARSLPPEKVDPNMTEAEVLELLASFLREDEPKQTFEQWKEEVKKAHPEHASKMQFKGRSEGGKETISAEVPGLDRSFGVWSGDDDGEGTILGD